MPTVDFTDTSESSEGISSWHWNFGDGQVSTSQNPSHNYEEGGIYQVTLTVTDAAGNHDTRIQTVVVEEEEDDEFWEHDMDVTAQHFDFFVPNTVESIPTPGWYVTDYHHPPPGFSNSLQPHWSESEGFVPGITRGVQEALVVRKYFPVSDPKIMLTSVTFFYEWGNFGEYPFYDNSEEQCENEPFWNIESELVRQISMKLRVVVRKAGGSQYYASPNNLTFITDPGNGSITANVNIGTYSDPNNYRLDYITFEVEGLASSRKCFDIRLPEYLPPTILDGYSDFKVTSIHMEGYSTDPITAAAFDYSADALEVTFTDQSTGGTVTDWDWDFGDGFGSSLQNPVHTFPTTGTYTVSLDATIDGEHYFTDQEITVTGDYDWESTWDFTASNGGFSASLGGAYSEGVGWASGDFAGSRGIFLYRNTGSDVELTYVKAVLDWEKGAKQDDPSLVGLGFHRGGLSPIIPLDTGTTMGAMPTGPIEIERVWSGSNDEGTRIAILGRCSTDSPPSPYTYGGTCTIKSLIVRGMGSKPSGWP